MNRTDPLVRLAHCRQALIANKARDFAAEIDAKCGRAIDWPAQTHFEARSVATGLPIRTRSRAHFNADERAYARHTLLFAYRDARRRAMLGAPLYALAFEESLIRGRRRMSRPAFNMVAFADNLLARVAGVAA
jgi:hypothetical protein